MGTGSPLYIKTYPMNIYFVILCLSAHVVIIYNMIKLKFKPSRLSVIALGLFPIMFVSGICDNIFDLTVNYSSKNFSDKSLMSMLIVVLITSLFSIAYMISFHTFCRGLYIRESKAEKINTASTEDKILMKPLTATDEDAPVYENDNDEYDQVSWATEWDTKSNLEDLESFSGMFERYINVNLSLNLVWGLGVYNLCLTIMYIVRLVAYTQTTLVRDTDVVLASLVIIAITIPTAVYDWWKFQVYTGPIFMHYVTFAVVLFSDFLSFYGFVGAVDILTLSCFLVEIGLITYKIVAYSKVGLIPHYKRD